MTPPLSGRALPLDILHSAVWEVMESSLVSGYNVILCQARRLVLVVSAWGSGVVDGSAYTDSKGKTQLSGSPLCQSWRALMLDVINNSFTFSVSGFKESDFYHLTCCTRCCRGR